ncbi:TIGR02117 family protein [Sphingomonas sp. GC_Shp_2]|uniref:TIGR02117 family protein n=1 Tax=unclassified Sphingomonas TaxID=196159 RepID=UPI003211F644
MTIAVARKWGNALLGAAMAALLGYAAAGLISGAIPTHAGWRPPVAGVPVYLESNGIHVGIVVPKRAAGVDWRPIARPGGLRDPRYAAYDHLAIGWGERGFYLGTPTWSDIRPATIATAAIGSDATLVHLEHVPTPVPGGDVRRILLRPEEYRRLAAFVRASIVAGGRHDPGYGDYDVFVQARGHYDAVHTCNAWVGEALRAAGVRVGAWTPFPVTLLGWFPPEPPVPAPTAGRSYR